MSRATITPHTLYPMSLQHPFGIIPTYIKPANVGSDTEIATLPSVSGVKCAQWFGDRRAIILLALLDPCRRKNRATRFKPTPHCLLSLGGVEPPGIEFILHIYYAVSGRAFGV